MPPTEFSVRNLKILAASVNCSGISRCFEKISRKKNLNTKGSLKNLNKDGHKLPSCVTPLQLSIIPGDTNHSVSISILFIACGQTVLM